MGGWTSIGSGLRASLARPRLVVGVYVAELFFAIVVAAPLLAFAFDAAAHAPAAARLATSFDFAGFLEVTGSGGDRLVGAAGFLRYGAAAWLAVASVLAGGILATFASCRATPRGATVPPVHPVTLAAFAAGCGRYAGRMLRLTLVAVAGLAGLQFLNGALEAGWAALSAGRDVAWVEWGRWGKGGALAFLLFVGLAVLDYARARVVLEDRRSVLLALGKGVRLIARRPVASLAIPAAFAAASVAMLAGWLALERVGLGAVSLVLAALAAQAVVLTRTGLRVACHAAQYDLVRRDFLAEMAAIVHRAAGRADGLAASVRGAREIAAAAADDPGPGPRPGPGPKRKPGSPAESPAKEPAKSTAKERIEARRPGGPPPASGALIVGLGVALGLASTGAVTIALASTALREGPEPAAATDPSGSPAERDGAVEVTCEVDALLDVPRSRVYGTARFEWARRDAWPIDELELRVPPAVAVRSVELDSPPVDLDFEPSEDDARLLVRLPDEARGESTLRLRVAFSTRLALSSESAHGDGGGRVNVFWLTRWLPRIDVPASMRVTLAIPADFEAVADAPAARDDRAVGDRAVSDSAAGDGAAGDDAVEDRTADDGTRRVRFRADGARDVAIVVGRHLEFRTRELPRGDASVRVDCVMPPGLDPPVRRLPGAIDGALAAVEAWVGPWPGAHLAVAGRPDRVAISGGAESEGAESGGVVPVSCRSVRWPGDVELERELLAGLARRIVGAGALGRSPVHAEGAARFVVDRVLDARHGDRGAAMSFARGGAAAWALDATDRGRWLEVPVGPGAASISAFGIEVAPFVLSPARWLGRRSDRGGEMSLFGLASDPRDLAWPSLATAGSASRIGFLRGGARPGSADHRALALATVARHAGEESVRHWLRSASTAGRDGEPRFEELGQIARRSLERARGSRDLATASLAAFDLGLVDRLVGELLVADRSVDFAVERIDVARTARADVEGAEADAGASAPASTPLYRAEVVVRQLGDARLPAEVELRFADGSTRRTVFRGDADHETLTAVHTAPVVAAEVDPDRRYAVDRAFVNNARSAEPLRREAASIAGTILFFVQTALQTLAALA